ncbi:MAG: sensor histidine kinase [Pleurocapsa sp.]
MSEGSGLILRQQSKTLGISSLNLLILSDLAAEVENICSSLSSAGINFTYEAIALNPSAWELSAKDYDAILYSYSSYRNYSKPESPLEQLDWWYALPKQIPLILITEKLDAEIAVQLLQSGVSDYVLQHKLNQLPSRLERTLIIAARKQQQQKQQLNLIKQQQQRIQQLEAERLVWEAAKAEQQQRIEQLEAEKLIWEAAETDRQEHISHLVHELRRPTSSIIGFARMLKDQLYGSLNAKQMQYAAALLTTGQHLLDLVNNYLALAKIEANQEVLNLEKLAVADVCQAALLMLEQQAQEKDISLILHLENDIDFCFADRVRLKQILVNLISNAVKFTNCGSVTLDVKIRDNMLYFEVCDTGIGISPDHLDKLFQPFQQINHHPEGTGLGLTLSRKLARLHGGDITVTSEVGKGSCFTLSILHG